MTDSNRSCQSQEIFDSKDKAEIDGGLDEWATKNTLLSIYVCNIIMFDIIKRSPALHTEQIILHTCPRAIVSLSVSRNYLYPARR
jgi:hypothetical protein